MRFKDFCTFVYQKLAMPTEVGNTVDMNTTSIYEIPAISSLMKAWKATITPTMPKGDVDAHNALMRAIKMEQIKRGQRTKMTYAIAK